MSGQGIIIIEQLRAEVERLRERAEKAERERVDAIDAMNDERETLAATEAALQTALRERDEARDERDALRAELAESEVIRRGWEDSCRIAERERDEARAHTTHGAYRAVCSERDKALATIKRLERERDEADTENARLVAERDEAKRQITAAERERDEARRDAERECREWAREIELRKAAVDRANRAENARDVSELRWQKASAERANLRAERDEARAERDAALAALEESRDDVREMRGILHDHERMLDEARADRDARPDISAWDAAVRWQETRDGMFANAKIESALDSHAAKVKS